MAELVNDKLKYAFVTLKRWWLGNNAHEYLRRNKQELVITRSKCRETLVVTPQEAKSMS